MAPEKFEAMLEAPSRMVVTGNPINVLTSQGIPGEEGHCYLSRDMVRVKCTLIKGMTFTYIYAKWVFIISKELFSVQT